MQKSVKIMTPRIKPITNFDRLKAESDIYAEFPIRTLSSYALICTRTSEEYDKLIADIKSEAYKEFAERVKKEMQNVARMEYGSGEFYFLISEKFIDNLLKEMG